MVQIIHLFRQLATFISLPCKKCLITKRSQKNWKVWRQCKIDGGKVVNPDWWQRIGCGSRLIAKILITKIQVNLCQFLEQSKFTWIVIINIFVINQPPQPILGRQPGFHNFFHPVHFTLDLHLNLQLGCFLVEVRKLELLPTSSDILVGI